MQRTIIPPGTWVPVDLWLTAHQHLQRQGYAQPADVQAVPAPTRRPRRRAAARGGAR